LNIYFQLAVISMNKNIIFFNNYIIHHDTNDIRNIKNHISLNLLYFFINHNLFLKSKSDKSNVYLCLAIWFKCHNIRASSYTRDRNYDEEIIEYIVILSYSNQLN